MRKYDRYCPVAASLDVVGERWTLLLVHELMDGPLRFTDLAERLDGIGTNILADRLKKLEGDGILVKRKLKPPAASTVYELTDEGRELQAVLHSLALWGLRRLGAPAEADLHPGWLVHALRLAVPLVQVDAPDMTIAFRSGEETATLRIEGGTVTVTADEAPGADALVEGDGQAFYRLLAQGDPGAVAVTGSAAAVEAALGAAVLQPV